MPRRCRSTSAGIAGSDQVRWIAINPYGVPVESTSSLVCFTNLALQLQQHLACLREPAAGRLGDRGGGAPDLPEPGEPLPAERGGTGRHVDPASQTLASVQAGVPSALSWKVTNTLGAVSAAPKGGSLGSALRDRKTVGHDEHQQFTVTVPEGGAERLTATIGRTSDLGADLDLFVKDAAGKILGQAADGDSEESVTLPNPAAGTYTVEVHGYSVPAGTTQYDYLDVFFSSALGVLSTTDTTVDLAVGGSATMAGALTAKGSPAAGRQLFGEMRVVSTAGAVLGTGSVVVGSVTP